MKPRILVVEDERPILMGLCDVLAFHGWEPVGVADGREGLAKALAEAWDLLLLDVMLPGVDGFSICRRVREVRPRQAVLLLTARGAEADILEGFSAGADDYVTKPFSVAQLVARVQALLRRAGAQPPQRFQAGPLEVDGDRLRATRDGHSVDLNARDVDLLGHLASAGARVVGRVELLQAVWGFARAEGVETRCVDMHVVKLRRKLQALTEAPIIETVRGAGYRLAGHGD
jgi:two-component system response regulator RegX3